MRAVDIIQKKRNGGSLTNEELSFLIQGYSRGEIPDYQMSAWAMAVFFRGMNAGETAALTMAMAESGDLVDLTPIRGIKVDKHSTGGVGDKTSLVIGPLVASCGVPVAKMSGRGLGHTGGTIDKMESMAGFRSELSREDFIAQVNDIGVAIIGQSGNLAPADKKLYALRDVTATVESIPLIASSVMSKKIAAGADAIVLDVKTGSGAFMKTLDDSEKLAMAMVEIGTQVGRRTAALISDMDQPLGFAIGNALEVREAIDTLHGRGPDDLTSLCIALASHMVVLGGQAGSLEEAEAMLREKLRSGEALAKFKQFVAAQGGNPDVADDATLLPQAPHIVEVPAPKSGHVHAIQAEELGLAAMLLGAGRETKDSVIDYAVGITLQRKVGEEVREGQTIALLHVREEGAAVQAVLKRVQEAYTIDEAAVLPSPLLLSIVTEQGVKRF
ncbi:pyrimidine-nucleoside phosphorylase [Paenibacillus sacheonensis]|uniref:Pyrimidine-nucleoside phosphorylase n=1 Tax=Paenibacillus sacheonensis TaxID=742054 RepID=A0A7X4YMA7_9BACL|nr:pyrimidine-nucleoside phosphorylase [Paenibacillus sacheonensis]MBM7564419.1 pyrimidine-nucleoside phosphorylase [Paenibacillus sacheonensis]NBC68981.1 pyrimidine-nucleoside phosphorylase [Paenibacillus sacheonensis]